MGSASSTSDPIWSEDAARGILSDKALAYLEQAIKIKSDDLDSDADVLLINLLQKARGTHEVKKLKVVDFMERELVGSNWVVYGVGEEDRLNRSGREVNVSCLGCEGTIWAWIVVKNC